MHHEYQYNTGHKVNSLGSHSSDQQSSLSLDLLMNYRKSGEPTVFPESMKYKIYIAKNRTTVYHQNQSSHNAHSHQVACMYFFLLKIHETNQEKEPCAGVHISMSVN